MKSSTMRYFDGLDDMSHKNPILQNIWFNLKIREIITVQFNQSGHSEQSDQ